MSISRVVIIRIIKTRSCFEYVNKKKYYNKLTKSQSKNKFY